MITGTPHDIKSNSIISKQPATWMLLLLLVGLTFLVFYPTLSAYFVDYDDPQYLLRNVALSKFGQDWSWSGVLHLFTADAIGNYIPLTSFTYAIEHFFFAQDTLSSPFIFHLDNLLLHLCTTVCAFFLFRKMGVGKWAAFLGALLFGLHPMRVESVAWVTERKDVLYGFFFLLSLLAYINYIKWDRHKITWYLCALLCFILSCFAKVQAVTLPLCLVVLDVYFKRKWNTPKTLILEKLPWWLLSIAFGVVNVYILTSQKVIGSDEVLVHYNVLQKLALGAYAYAVYVVKFVYPYQMLAYYAFPLHVPIMAYLCLVLVPAIVVLITWKAKRNTIVLFALAFFTFNVIFVLQIVASGSTFLADRYTYIAYIGLFFWVAKAYEWTMLQLPRYRFHINIVLGLYCVLFAFMAYNQSKVWRNSVALWQHYIDDKPNDYYGYYQMAEYYTDILQYNLPDPYLDVNDPQFNTLPLKYLDTAIAKDSMDGRPIVRTTANLLVNHGVACEFTKMYATSISNYTQALALQPDMKDALEKRAWTYFYIKKYDLAMQDYDRYQQLDSNDDLMYYHRSLCEGNMNRLDDGMRDVNKAIALNGNAALYYITRSDFYKLRNMPDSMHIDAQKAKQLGGDVPAMLLN
ncbi:MAG: hypothetical protein P4L41_17950 [Flavipsychrobacter sp.]|nr:hypothetical protein [Flavipsychrobacter sp.]